MYNTEHENGVLICSIHRTPISKSHGRFFCVKCQRDTAKNEEFNLPCPDPEGCKHFIDATKKDITGKTVKKILEYQAVILRLLTKRSYDVFELENICLCRIGHVACFESFVHALEDLSANGRIKRFESTITKAQ